MVAHAKWMVSEIVDPREPTLPRYVIAHRQGEAPWLRVWEHRDIPGRLAAWFKTLAEAKLEPLARPLLGHGCALNEETAHAVCQFRISQIRAMSGCPPGEWPDFLLNDKPVNCGKRGRPCCVISADGVKTYPTISSAAAAEGVARPTVGRRVRQGRLYRGGLVAV
jgi:hypothetical protein